MDMTGQKQLHLIKMLSVVKHTCCIIILQLPTRLLARTIAGSVSSSAVWDTSCSVPLTLFCKRLKETKNEQYCFIAPLTTTCGSRTEKD